MRTLNTTLLLAAALTAGSCGGGSSSSAPTTPAPQPTPTPAPATVEVAFTYQAATAVDPAVDYATCSPTGVEFTTHLHFIWNAWDDRRYMVAAGPNLFEYTGEVPADQDVEIALHDPNVCLQGSVYVAPTELRANGVLLNQEVRVQDGTGVTFRVSADGTVTP